MRVSVRADGALTVGPKAVLTDELAAAVQRLKPAIVAVLRANGVEVSRRLWLADYTALLARVNRLLPSWARGCLDSLPAALRRRLVRAEGTVDATARQLEAGDTTAPEWRQALAELEAVWIDVARHVENER